MGTIKYWVKYQSDIPISNIVWNTIDSASNGGIVSVPQNTWYQIYDSGIEYSVASASNSLLEITASLQVNPSIIASENLSYTASNNN